MKITILFLAMAMTIASCDKPEPPVAPKETHPQMSYIDLAGKTVSFGEYALIDVDKDGSKDILFSTELVGDPLAQQDKHQWLITSSFFTNLPVKDENIPLLNYGDSISVQNFSGYEWFNASSILMAQKIIDMVRQPWWEGDWRQASHHYLPLQINKSGQLYNGWVEVSFNVTEEKLILHRAAICVEANRKVKAGWVS